MNRWKPSLYSDAGLHMVSGMKIVVSELLTEPCEDFSASRSPSRARRRWRRRGILGRGVLTRPACKAVQIGDTLHMHPAMLAALNKELKRRMDRDIMRAIAGLT